MSDSRATTVQIEIVQRILKTNNLYEILDVPRDAEEDVLKKSYKKLALKLHPDKNSATGAEEAFKKVSEAFQVLSDVDRRRQYDITGRVDNNSMPSRGDQPYNTPEEMFNFFFHNMGHRGAHMGGGPFIFRTTGDLFGEMRRRARASQQQPNEDGEGEGGGLMDQLYMVFLVLGIFLWLTNPSLLFLCVFAYSVFKNMMNQVSN